MFNVRTIISAMNPWRFEDDYTIIFMAVWFEEKDFSFFENYPSSLLDCEPHGRELWFRAMKGEYGPIEIITRPQKIERPKMMLLTYDEDKR